MGYIKERMTRVNAQRSINPYAFSADNEIAPYVVVIDCTSRTQTVFTYALKEAVRVIDAWAVSATAQTGAVATLEDTSGNAISSAMIIASDKAVGRTTTIDDANWDEVAGNNLQVTQSAAADSCWVFAVVVAKK